MFINLKYKPHHIEQQNWGAIFGVMFGLWGLDYRNIIFPIDYIWTNRN